MRLSGYGSVIGVEYDSEEMRYLSMNWSDQNNEIDVPYIECSDTVNVHLIEKVQAKMPDYFFTWLQHPYLTPQDTT